MIEAKKMYDLQRAPNQEIRIDPPKADLNYSLFIKH